MKLKIECRERGCDQFKTCGERFVELSESRYQEALKKAVAKKDPGAVYLDVCPRFGAQNPLCFILVQVNDVFTKHYADCLEQRVELLKKRLLDEQDNHRDSVSNMTRELNRHLSTLGSIGGQQGPVKQTG